MGGAGKRRMVVAPTRATACAKGSRETCAARSMAIRRPRVRRACCARYRCLPESKKKVSLTDWEMHPSERTELEQAIWLSEQKAHAAAELRRLDLRSIAARHAANDVASVEPPPQASWEVLWPEAKARGKTLSQALLQSMVCGKKVIVNKK